MFPNLVFWGPFLTQAVFLRRHTGKKLSHKRSVTVNCQYFGARFTLNYQMVPFHPKSKVCQNKLHWDIPWCFRKEKEHCSLFSRMQSLAPYRQEKEASWRELNGAFCRQESFIWRKGEGTSSKVAWSRMKGTKGTFRTPTLFLTPPMTCCEFGSTF